MRTAMRRTSAPLSTSSGGGCLDAHVVASHEVAPEFREYERASTTAADAYLGPIVSRYLGALARRGRGAGLPAPLVMRSSGGVATPAKAAEHPATILVSGPAAGVVGAARHRCAGRHRRRDRVRHGRDVDGRLPDRRRQGGARAASVGRRAADPPPDGRPAHRRRRRRLARLARRRRRACASGRRAPARIQARRVTGAAARRAPSPTRTSCSAGYRSGSQAASSSTGAAAERALDGIDPAAVIDVVNAEMLRALRVVSVERGHDPAGFALVAFGGAGPLHACELAEELGIANRARPRSGRRSFGAWSRRVRRTARRCSLVPCSACGGRRAPVRGRSGSSLRRTSRSS